jgi:hypothetical protein
MPPRICPAIRPNMTELAPICGMSQAMPNTRQAPMAPAARAYRVGASPQNTNVPNTVLVSRSIRPFPLMSPANTWEPAPDWL